MSFKPHKRRLILRSDTQKRQSFSERICDDLCEVILQYLPLKDKLRLQCVSKQFRSQTIFENVLNVTFQERHLSVQSLPIDLNGLESVLKKCPNIEYLDLFCNYFNYGKNGNDFNLLMDLIIENCNHLTSIVCYFNLMNPNIRTKFIEKFGPKLKWVYDAFIFDGTPYQHFPNIELIEVGVFSTFLPLSHIQFKQLKRLLIAMKSTQINHFRHFVSINPNIEELNLRLIPESNNTWVDFNLVLNLISKLKNLVKLEIFCGDTLRLNIEGLNQKPFHESLRTIALNCPKIKRIGCDVTIDSDKYLEMSQLLSSLKVFKHLKRLDIRLHYNKCVDSTQMFSCKALKGFEKLTHLSINCQNTVHRIDDTILTDIDINLPELRYLNIIPVIDSSDSIHIILKRLTSLQTIKLNIKDNKICQQIKTKLIEHFKKFKTIQINSQFI